MVVAMILVAYIKVKKSCSMNKRLTLRCLLLFLFFSGNGVAQSDELKNPLKIVENSDKQELITFAELYFERWSASQQPNATKDDIDKYLSLLSADVGHQHLTYSPDDTRAEGALMRMREGMAYYLGSHSSYEASLMSVMVDFNVVIIQYQTKSAGIHPQTKEMIKQSYSTVEVLEMDSGKISTIRKYSE